MSADPFLGQVTMFGGNFAPRGWALCQGQLLAISQNSALFSLLGTIYGGDGRTTFALPDLRGRGPVSQGNGPGLSPRNIGARTGVESTSLNGNNVPPHSHPILGNEEGTTDDPSGAYIAGDGTNKFSASQSGAGAATANNQTSNLPITNMQPFLAINYIIALQGTYPSRN